MHRIIIDTDPGVDDAQAIAYALAHPSIELLGLTTVFGNAAVEQTTNNALTILETFGHENVPVARGAEVPLEISPFAAPDFVHGADGLGNIDSAKPKGSPHLLPGPEFIVDCANRYPQELIIVGIGPLTNLARALELDASLASKVKHVIVMGGTVNAHGNVSPVAEANFINDPDAADRVCQAGWPLTLIGLDVTMQIALRDSHFEQLRRTAGDVGRFLWSSSRYYVDFYSRTSPVDDKEPACAMHDASALVYLTHPHFFTTQSGPALVITDGPAQGQLILGQADYPYLLKDWQSRPPVNAAMTVESEYVLSAFMDTLIEYYSPS